MLKHYAKHVGITIERIRPLSRDHVGAVGLFAHDGHIMAWATPYLQTSLLDLR